MLAIFVMMSTFAVFRKNVLSYYLEKKKMQEMDERLANPSPANLRDYCLIRLSEGLPETDIQILKKFFDPYNKSDNLEETIQTYPTGWLKALQKFILGKTTDPDELIVKLLAILVDYQPRPFRYTYNEMTVSQPVPSVDTGTKDASENRAIGEINSRLKNETIKTVISERNTKQVIPVSQSFLSEKRNILRISGVILAMILIFFTIRHFTPKDCMCWNGERYVEVDCQDKGLPYQIIGLDKNKLIHFQKITRPDTLTEQDIGKVWYSKIDNKVEFFTSPGFHPAHHGKSLKVMTNHIWGRYAGEEAALQEQKESTDSP